MARCFLTGVDLPIENSYLIDAGPAYRVLRDLKQRAATIERLINQLMPQDDVEVYDAKKRETVTIKYRRLVSPAVAETLAAVCPQVRLFIKWSEWQSRHVNSESKGNTGEPDHDDSRQ